MNPLQRNESRDVSDFFSTEVVADITTSQLKTWKHIIWQREQHERHNIIHQYITIMLLIYCNTINIKIHLLYENKHQLHANMS
jgi:uncharacterized protein with HEPN domain